MAVLILVPPIMRSIDTGNNGIDKAPIAWYRYWEWLYWYGCHRVVPIMAPISWYQYWKLVSILEIAVLVWLPPRGIDTGNSCIGIATTCDSLQEEDMSYEPGTAVSH